MPAENKVYKICINFSMLKVIGVGGRSSSGKFSSETVKIFDIQTLCFWLSKDHSSIPARLINKPNNCGDSNLPGNWMATGGWQPLSIFLKGRQPACSVRSTTKTGFTPRCATVFDFIPRASTAQRTGAGIGWLLTARCRFVRERRLVPLHSSATAGKAGRPGLQLFPCHRADG